MTAVVDGWVGAGPPGGGPVDAAVRPPDPGPGHVRPADPAPLVVRGGAGGTRASLEAMAAAASRLDRAAEHLREADRALRRASAAADGMRLPALARLTTWRGGPGITALCAADLADGLRRAVRAYADADDAAAARLRTAALVALAHGWGEAGPAAWALGAAGGAVGLAGLGRALLALQALRRNPSAAGLLLTALTAGAAGRDDLAGVLARAVAGDGLWPPDAGLPHGDTVEALVPVLAAWLVGAMPGRSAVPSDPVHAVALLALVASAVVAARTGAPDRRVLVAPLVGTTTPPDGRAGGAMRQPPAPAGLGDVVAQVAELGAEPGPVVGVQRLDHPDGTTSWVVAVPGTRSFDLGGANPMDNRTNLELLTGRPDAMSEAIEVAMLRAGVGPDDPVVLAGHSQGGMAAMRAAARLQGTYRLAAVVTAGSPVGGMPAPECVPVLHLEHAQDWVPALDGRPNPDTPLRTTVVRTLPAADGVGSGLTLAGLGAAHEARAYAATAEVVAQSDHPSVRQVEATLAEVLGGGRASASQQRYAVVRVPVGDAVSDGPGWPATGRS
jgi:pimeloyl-ACP methyl ester carboxylesterase